MNLEPLLSFIGRHEGRGNPDIVWGGIRKADYPPKRLSTMTIQEVLNWQDSIDHKYRSEAAGVYQIMEDTLRGLYAQAGLKASDLYSYENQRKLAIALLKRRGLDSYVAGKISAEQFGLNVAKEWASMPVPVKGHQKYGRSYYDGDGLNSTKVKVADFMAPIYAIKQRVPVITPVQPSPPRPTPAPGAGGGKGIGKVLPFFVGKALTIKPLEKRMGSTLKTEAARLVRHGITPVAVFLVAAGILPEFMQAEFVEIAVVVATFVVSLVWSRFTGKQI